MKINLYNQSLKTNMMFIRYLSFCACLMLSTNFAFGQTCPTITGSLDNSGGTISATIDGPTSACTSPGANSHSSAVINGSPGTANLATGTTNFVVGPNFDPADFSGMGGVDLTFITTTGGIVGGDLGTVNFPSVSGTGPLDLIFTESLDGNNFIVNVTDPCGPDTEDPMLSCVSATTAPVDDITGILTILPGDVLQNLLDNCAAGDENSVAVPVSGMPGVFMMDDITITIVPATLDCDDIGSPQSVMVIASDNATIPNTAECTAIVNVEDTQDPMAMCPTALGGTGGADGPYWAAGASAFVEIVGGTGTLAENALAGGNSTDNCSVTETSPETDYDCTHIVAFQTVTLTATDPSTNSNTTDCDIAVGPPAPDYSAVVVTPVVCSDQDAAQDDIIIDLQDYKAGMEDADFTITTVDYNGLTGGVYSNGDVLTGTDITDGVLNTTSGTVTITYTVTPTHPTSGCVGATFDVDVDVRPQPVVADGSGTTCSNVAPGANATLNNSTNLGGVDYTITAVDNGAAVGVSGGAELYGTSLPINSLFQNVLENDVWTNTTSDPIDVVYTISPRTNLSPTACFGDPFTFTLTVNPEPVGTAGAEMVCSDFDYTLTFQDYVDATGGNAVASTFAWTAVVTGTLDNAPTAAGSTSTVTENLTNTSGADAQVTYTVTPTSDPEGCEGTPFDVVVTVKYQLEATDPADETICSGDNAMLDIVTTDPNTEVSFTWTSNSTIGGAGTATSVAFGADAIDDGPLTNTTNAEIDVTYTITPYTHGPDSVDDGGTGDDCLGTPFDVVVTVEPFPTMNVNIIQPSPAPVTNIICANFDPRWDFTTDITSPQVNMIKSFVYEGVEVFAPTTFPLPLLNIGYNLVGFNNTSNDYEEFVVVCQPYTFGPNGIDDGGTVDDCLGDIGRDTLRIEPVATGIDPADETICSGENGTFDVETDLVITNTSFNWTSNSAIGGAGSATMVAFGTDAVDDGPLVNITNAPIDVTYTITPYTWGPNETDDGNTGDDCPGTPFDVIITVEPMPVLQARSTINDGGFSMLLDGDDIVVCSDDSNGVGPDGSPNDNIDVQVRSLQVPTTPANYKYFRTVEVTAGAATGPVDLGSSASLNGTFTDNVLFDDAAWDNVGAIDAVVTVTLTPYIDNDANDMISTGDCVGDDLAFTVIIHPEPDPIAGLSAADPIIIEVCNLEPFSYNPADNIANIPGDTEWRINRQGGVFPVTGEPGNSGGGNYAGIDLLEGTIENISSVTQEIDYLIENVRSISNGCEGDDFWVTLRVSPPVLATLSPGGDLELCAGEERIVSATATQGTGTNFTYAWTLVDTDGTGSTIDDATAQSPTITAGTVPGDFDVEVVVTDEQGCTSQLDYSITFSVLPVPTSADATLEACEDPAGSGSAVFSLMDADSDVLNGLNPADYTVSYHGSVSDANLPGGALPNTYTSAAATIFARTEDNATGCFSVTEVTLDINFTPALDISGTDVSCFGGSDGTANVNITNEILPASTIDFSDDYAPANWAITQPGGSTVSISSTEINVSTSGFTLLRNAGLTITAPVDVRISFDYTASTPGGFINTAYGGIGTLFDATVLDDGTGSDTLFVGAGQSISFGIAQSFAGGTATLNVSNFKVFEVDDYDYEWSNSETTPGITGLTAGTYTVTVTTDKGCESTASVVIEEPNLLTASSPSPIETCNGTGATISVTANGGTSGYIYSLDGTDLVANPYQEANFFLNVSAGTYSNITVQDANGCIAVANPVTVNADVIPPTIGVCPADITMDTPTDECDVEITYLRPSVQDNCQIQTWVVSYAAGTPAPSQLPTDMFLGSVLSTPTTETFYLGETVVTYTATDASGNMNECTFNVTVTEDDKPSFEDPDDVTVTTMIDAAACPAASTMLSLAGPYPETVTSGMSYTIGDGIDMVTLTAPALEAIYDMTTATYADGGYADACDADPVLTLESADFVTGRCASTWTLVWLVTDDYNNTETQTQVITIEDDTAPALTAAGPAPIVGEDYCAADAVANNPFDALYAVTGYTDNCGGVVTATETNAVFAPDADCGWTITYTYEVEDECNNVLADQTYTISGSDQTAPTGLAPAAITGVDDCADDALANNPFDEAYVIAGYSDNCLAAVTATETSAVLAPDADCGWTITYTYTVFDQCLNPLAGEMYTISGSDQSAPVVTDALNATLVEGCTVADAPAAYATVAELEAGGVTITETCADDADITVQVSDDGGVGTCPIVLTRTYTVTDQCTNVSLPFDHVITIDDTTAPDVAGSLTATLIEGCTAADAPAAYATVAELEAGGVTITDVCSDDVDITVDVTSDGGIGTCPVVMTRTYTVTDVCMNTSATFDHVITIDDTTAPDVAGSLTATLVEGCTAADAPAAYATVAELEAGGVTITDVCSDDADITVDVTSDGGIGTCPVVMTRTYTVTDVCLNTSVTFDHVITIDDTTAPDVAGSLTATLVEGCTAAAAPAAYATVAELEAGGVTITDICSNDADITVDVTSDGGIGTCPIVVTRTYTVTDVCLNESVDIEHVITIEDTTDPDLVDGDVLTTVECDGAGNTAELAAWLASNAGATATDNCSAVTWTNNFAGMSDDCGETGTTMVGAAAMIDIEVNILTDNFSEETSWEVRDGDDVVILSGGPYIQNVDDGTLFEETVTVAVPAGVIGSYTLYVFDSFGDGIFSPGYWELFVDGASVGVGTGDIDNGPGDEATLSGTFDNTAAPTTEGPVTFIATDACGNTATFDATFTIEDTVGPDWDDLAGLPVNTSENVSASDCEFDLVLAVPTATDMCSGVADVTLSGTDVAGDPITVQTAGGIFFITLPVGLNNLTLTATDDCGEVTTHDWSFDVVDPVMPEITCPPTLTAACIEDAPAEYANAFLFQTNGGILDDNCTLNPSSFAMINADTLEGVGSCIDTIVRTYYIEDASTNSNTCEQRIIINDDVAPTFTFEPASVSVECGDSTDPIDTGEATATDNCVAGATVTYDDVTLLDGCGGYTGTITRTWTAVDGCDNSVDYVQIITIEDTTAPELDVAGCNDLAIELDATGNYTLTQADLEAIVGSPTDACATVFTLSADINDFDCSSTAGPTSVTVTIKDPCDNEVTCTVNVTATEIIPPVAMCNDITVELDAAGMYMLTTADSMAIVAGTTDNCVDFTYTFSQNTFECADIAAPVVLTVVYEDNSGNTSTCDANITVEDNTAPTITCPGDDTVVLDATNCTAVLPDYTAAATSDVCGTVTVTQDPAPGSPYTAEAMVLVTLTANDGNGNETDCTFSVSVEDQQAPIAMCNDITVELDASGMYTLTTADSMAIVAGTTDNCNDYTYTLSQSDFTCADLATPVVVTVTYTDGSGNMNTSTCDANITVEDNTAPAFTCPSDDVIILDGTCMITMPDYTAGVLAGATDACGTVTVTQDPLEGTLYSAEEVVVVTITVDDGNGNMDECMFNVAVEDQAAPIAMCNDITVELDAAGMYTLTTADSMAIVAGTTDNCSDYTYTISQNTFDCGDLAAPVVVTVTYTDGSGNANTSTCDATITVEDNSAPVFSMCPVDVEIETPATSCFVAYDDIPFAEVTDNCTAIDASNLSITIMVESLSIDANITDDGAGGYLINAPDGLPAGDNVITVTADDGNGNPVECTWTVAVVDIYEPFWIDCPSDIVVSAPVGDCEQQVFWNEPDAQDFCVVISTTTKDQNGNDVFPGYEFPVGETTTVTYTAFDASGNAGVCVFTITVNGSCEEPTPDIRMQWQLPFNGILATNQVKDAVLRVREVGGIDTDGTIQVIVPARPGYEWDFDPLQTTATNPNTSVGNLDDLWDGVVLPNGNLLLTTEATIPANGQLKVAIKIKAIGAMNTNNLRATLIPGSGGDANASNNSSTIGITTL